MINRLDAVRAMVDDWQPTDERGEMSKQSTLEYLSRSSDEAAFERNAANEHITGSAIVVSRAGVLLHKHKLAQLWMGPGGHVDSGELPGDAAVRETFEETGVRASHPGEPHLLRVDTHKTTNEHVHHDLCFVLVSGADIITPGEGESPEAGWFGFETAAGLASGSFAGAIAQAAELHLDLPR